MLLSPQLEYLMGKHWVLRSTAPIELSPAEDLPPFAREMISIKRFSGMADIRSVYTSMAKTMGPILWAGSMAYHENSGYDKCATIEVVGNPLSGPVLFVAKMYQQVQETILLIYELNEQADDLDAIVDEIGRLELPLLQDENLDLIEQSPPVEEKYPVPRLLKTLQSTPLYSRFQAAFAEKNLVKQYLMVALNIADIADESRFVRYMNIEAFADLVRAAEGVSTTFIRLDIAPAIMWSASILARVLLLHPHSDDKWIARSLQLSELLMNKVRGISAERMEEAILTNLIARAKLATKNSSEDYGNLRELVRELKGDRGKVYRILLRLIMSHACVPGQGDLTPTERVARCDLAIELMQEMHIEGVKVGPDSESEPRPLDLDNEYESLPDEFRLVPDRVENIENFQLLSLIIAIQHIVLRNVEKIYGINIERVKEGVGRYLEEHRGSEVAPDAVLLFLRGFRSSKRIWVENNFELGREGLIPFVQEPSRLSIEAALNKGLGTHFGAIAIGGLPDPLGMARMSTPLQQMDLWKTTFEALSNFARIILVLPDSSDALTWEIGRLIDRGYLGRVLLLMVPAALDTKADASWEQVRTVFRNKGHALCPYRASGCFILLSGEGSVREEFEFSSLTNGALGDRLHEIFPT